MDKSHAQAQETRKHNAQLRAERRLKEEQEQKEQLLHSDKSGTTPKLHRRPAWRL